MKEKMKRVIQLLREIDEELDNEICLDSSVLDEDFDNEYSFWGVAYMIEGYMASLE